MKFSQLSLTERRKITVLRLGYTQKRLAKKLKISEAYLSLWIAGKRNSTRIEAALQKMMSREKN